MTEMFEPTSRYFTLRDLLYTTSDGRHQIPYKQRRFQPSANEIQISQEIAFSAGDRLDLIAFRTLGDSERSLEAMRCQQRYHAST